MLPSGQLRHTFDSAGNQARNFSRPSDVCSWFWTFIASESSIVSKTFSSFVSMILSRGVKVIDCMRSMIRSCRTLHKSERFACFFSLLLFLFLLPLTFKGRRCIFIMRLFLYRAHGAVDEKSQQLNKRFKMSVQHDILLDSICPQSAMLRINSLVFSISLGVFFMLTYICSSLANKRRSNCPEPIWFSMRYVMKI